MTDARRAGDTGTRKYFRSGRYSVSNGKYFFTTREGTMEGPFDNREEAERALALWIRQHSSSDIYGHSKKD